MTIFRTLQIYENVRGPIYLLNALSRAWKNAGLFRRRNGHFLDPFHKWRPIVNSFVIMRGPIYLPNALSRAWKNAGLFRRRNGHFLDPFHKWRPIVNSFVIISLTNLVFELIIQKHFYSQTSFVRLICMYTREF